MRRMVEAGHDTRQARELLANMRRSLDLVLGHAEAIARIDQAMGLPKSPSRGEAHSQIRAALAAMRAVARWTADTCSDPGAYASMIDERMGALVRCHNHIAANPNARADLQNVVTDELLYHGLDLSRIEISGPDVALPLTQAEVVSIVIHELAANALRFGAFSHNGGALSISWVGANGARRLIWRESGVHALIINPAHMGFGRSWIETAMPRDFGMRTALKFKPGGVQCEIYLDGD